MGYAMKNIRVTIAENGIEARVSFITDIYVDPAARASQRYQIGKILIDENGWQFNASQTLAWHELILPEDHARTLGFRKTTRELKLERGNQILDAMLALRQAESNLRSLTN